MAESKTNQAERKSTGQALARPDRDRGELLWRDPFAGRFGGGPWDVFDRMSSEMDRTFDRVWRDLFPRWTSGRSGAGSLMRGGLWSPRIEAFQQGDRFVVRADLPGMKKDDVEVELAENTLTIRGERQESREDEREGYYHSEREYGSFHRTIPLPEGVIGETAQASFRIGVLEISMQAAPEETSRGRRLEIKDAAETPDQKKNP